MLTRLSLNAKTGALLVITSLVVAYVRTYLQYHSYGWESVGAFLTSWFIHYLAVWVFVIVCGAFISSASPFFLGKDSQRRELTSNELLVFVALGTLAAALVLFVLAHWPASGSYE
ncbi:MAG: hypothetical protein A3H93_04815 [Rhodocyclales bacterium RIFCSPLOWO2_02_FULL_63_24]|nr:MAG: hypothetical protein A3H93_04815 [Rhodocyclales bacterium RIFCSPLOWO2_02_FULL_63_24]